MSTICYLCDRTRVQPTQPVDPEAERERQERIAREEEQALAEELEYIAQFARLGGFDPS